jgi:hypothetical protein
MPKKKTAKGAAPHSKPVTKTAFVLSLPKTLSAKEVIAKGKAAGISLSAAHVYAIRSASKSAKKSKRGAAAGHAPTTHARGHHGAEDLLRAVAAELGLANAMAILQAEHHKVQRLLGG